MYSLYVCSPSTVGNTFCGHLPSEKSVGRRVVANYLSADKLLATQNRYVYGRLKQLLAIRGSSCYLRLTDNMLVASSPNSGLMSRRVLSRVLTTPEVVTTSSLVATTPASEQIIRSPAIVYELLT